MFAQQGCCSLGTYALGTGDLVRRIATQCDEIGNLVWLHAVALAHLCRADPRHLPGFDRLENGRPLRRQLVGVAVTGCDDNRHAALFFLGRGRGKKVISLVPCGLGVGEAASPDELG